MPTISRTVAIHAARANFVIIHRNLALKLLVADDNPVIRDAASALTVCSRVRSTGHQLNGWSSPSHSEGACLQDVTKPGMRLINVEQVQLEFGEPTGVIDMICHEE